LEGLSDTENLSKDIVIKRTIEEKHNVRSIVKFAVPAMGVWLCSPVLSLIDTSAVGLFCGTIQQAALSPAVAITDYSALLLAFISPPPPT